MLDIVAESALVDLIAEGFDLGITLGEFVQKDMVACRNCEWWQPLPRPIWRVTEHR
ncbi:hypothetical protein GIX45_07795 [Erwinia sp. CPCC 100877]|nr:hypothetical protein [Erwinia sp. CPCC 100877]